MTGTWPLGWATSDVTLASEYRKGIGAISDTTLGGSAANVDVTGILGTYAGLMILVYARGDTATNSTFLNVRFNNDTAANYDWQRLSGTGTTVLAAETFAATAAGIGVIPANTAGANLFSTQVIFIPNYAGTTGNKAAASLSSLKVGTATLNLVADTYAAFWRSNAAINRITLLPAAGNFVAGTRVTVYALGA